MASKSADTTSHPDCGVPTVSAKLGTLVSSLTNWGISSDCLTSTTAVVEVASDRSPSWFVRPSVRQAIHCIIASLSPTPIRVVVHKQACARVCPASQHMFGVEVVVYVVVVVVVVVVYVVVVYVVVVVVVVVVYVVVVYV